MDFVHVLLVVLVVIIKMMVLAHWIHSRKGRICGGDEN